MIWYWYDTVPRKKKNKGSQTKCIVGSILTHNAPTPFSWLLLAPLAPGVSFVVFEAQQTSTQSGIVQRTW